MKTITINVTEEDIKNGIRCKPCNCPIAIAIKRVINTQEISIGPTWIYICRKEYSVPQKVNYFIRAFDHGSEGIKQEFVKPFTFSLEVNDDVPLLAHG